ALWLRVRPSARGSRPSDFLSCSCRCGCALAGRALLDVLDRVRHVHQALNVDARRDDIVGVDVAGLDQVLDLGNRHLAGGRHHRIEVARGLAVGEVALGIAHIGVHDGEVGDEPALHHVPRAVELPLLLALGDLRAGASAREEGRDTGAAGADALGERALGIELDLQLAAEVFPRDGLVLPDIGRDHLLDLLGVEQEAEPDAVDAAVVRHHGQVLHAGVADREDQLLGNAAQAEAAGHDHHAVLQQAGERRPRVGIDLFHERSASNSRTMPRRLRVRRTGPGILYRAATKAATSRAGTPMPDGSAGESGARLRHTHDAAKADVAGRSVDRLALARRRPVAQAVVGRAEMRTALHHTASDVTAGRAGHATGFFEVFG